MKTAIFFNTSSGTFKWDNVQKISNMIYKKEKELPTIFFTNEKIKKKDTLAKVNDFENILVSGGDGTLRFFAKALINTDKKLGIIPQGTVNVLARELNIPLDPIKATEIILNGNTLDIDVGEVNNKYFLNMVSCGIDATAVRNVRPVAKELIGSAAYVFEGIGSLLNYKPANYTINIDGEVLNSTAYIIIVTNTKKYGTGVNLVHNADITDGILDVCIFQKPVLSNLGFVLQVAETISGLDLIDKDIIFKKGKNIKIECNERVPTQIDGDRLGYTPMNISIQHKALNVFVP